MSELPPGFEVVVRQNESLPDGFEVVPPSDSLGKLKQLGAGAVESTASVPGSVPSGLKQIGGAISNLTGLPDPPPILNAPPTPEAQLSAALPQPQTPAEAAFREAGQILPQAAL